jgi:uncharacterized protein YoxC
VIWLYILAIAAAVLAVSTLVIVVLAVWWVYVLEPFLDWVMDGLEGWAARYRNRRYR